MRQREHGRGRNLPTGTMSRMPMVEVGGQERLRLRFETNRDGKFSTRYHEPEAHGRIMMLFARHSTLVRPLTTSLSPSFLPEADYNNGKILSAAVMVTSPETGSTATKVILSPPVTTTYVPLRTRVAQQDVLRELGR